MKNYWQRVKLHWLIMVCSSYSWCCDGENTLVRRDGEALFNSSKFLLLVKYRKLSGNFPESFRKLSVTETLPIFPEIFEPYLHTSSKMSNRAVPKFGFAEGFGRSRTEGFGFGSVRRTAIFGRTSAEASVLFGCNLL